MKKTVLLASMLFMAVCSSSFASTEAEYVVDDVAIEATLTSSVQVANIMPTATESQANASMAFGMNTPEGASIKAGKSDVTAFILAWFLGWIGVHRFYMGTATLTGVGYIITLGGCGIVAFVDWVVLLIALINKEGIAKYEDNPKFFMWGGK
ncbi:MAG: TM2 domain-containing protein [Spirosomataceae bacterium]